MRKHTINRKETGKFSDIVIDFLQNPQKFSDFITDEPTLENFDKQIQKKQASFEVQKRRCLVNALKKQYKDAELLNTNRENLINSLKNDNTFTVTTGHQLSIFTGPLFFIYKILHTINLAKELKTKYPTFNFVPIYWMASEDHDFEEIQSVNLFGKKYTWDSAQKGAVGRFKLTDFSGLKEELQERFEGEEFITNMLSSQYLEDDNLALASFKFVEYLFSNEELLILDADNKALKQQAIPIFEKEVKDQFSHTLVKQQSEKLTSLGYKQQVTPREINLFHIDEDGNRDRIIKNERGIYSFNSQKLKEDELETLLKEAPEQFSPNVVLRPIYQELILPNLAYIGGGGEISYWLQLKSVFNEIKLPFPLLQIRNSLQIVDKTSMKKLDKLGFNWKDMFKDVEELKKQYLFDNKEEELDFSELDDQAESLKKGLLSTVENLDKGLSGYARSEIAKLDKQVGNLKSKLVRHSKKREETSMKQIESTIERLFPDGGLQERNHNIIQYAVKNGDFSIIKTFQEHICPFENDLIVLME